MKAFFNYFNSEHLRFARWYSSEARQRSNKNIGTLCYSCFVSFLGFVLSLIYLKARSE